MNFIKHYLSIIVGAYSMLFELHGDNRLHQLYLLVYIGLSLVSSVLFIITFPWLALASFAMGFGLPFILSK